MRIFETWPICSTETVYLACRMTDIKCRLIRFYKSKWIIRDLSRMKNYGKPLNSLISYLPRSPLESRTHIWNPGCPPIPVEYPWLFWLLNWSFPTRCFHRAGLPSQPDNSLRTPMCSPVEGMRPWHPHYRPRSITLHTLYSRRKISRIKVGMCHSNITDFQNVQQRNIGIPLEKNMFKGKIHFQAWIATQSLCWRKLPLGVSED